MKSLVESLRGASHMVNEGVSAAEFKKAAAIVDKLEFDSATLLWSVYMFAEEVAGDDDALADWYEDSNFAEFITLDEAKVLFNVLDNASNKDLAVQYIEDASDLEDFAGEEIVIDDPEMGIDKDTAKTWGLEMDYYKNTKYLYIGYDRNDGSAVVIYAFKNAPSAAKKFISSLIGACNAF